MKALALAFESQDECIQMQMRPRSRCRVKTATDSQPCHTDVDSAKESATPEQCERWVRTE